MGRYYDYDYDIRPITLREALEITEERPFGPMSSYEELEDYLRGGGTRFDMFGKEKIEETLKWVREHS